MPYDVMGAIDALTEGLTRPNRWGHWYRGTDPVKRAIVAAAKAARRIEREEIKRLTWLMCDWQPEMPRAARCVRSVKPKALRRWVS